MQLYDWVQRLPIVKGNHYLTINQVSATSQVYTGCIEHYGHLASQQNEEASGKC